MRPGHASQAQHLPPLLACRCLYAVGTACWCFMASECAEPKTGEGAIHEWLVVAMVPMLAASYSSWKLRRVVRQGMQRVSHIVLELDFRRLGADQTMEEEVETVLRATLGCRFP